MTKNGKSNESSTQTATLMRSAFKAKPYPSQAELLALGKSLRQKCPRRSHAAWQPPHDRPDPLFLLEESSKGRIPQLLPIRYGRMLKSPFTFYRGSALNMAVDLAGTPATGLRVQACGDCHLCNFGCFATPEQREIFDINDLDETLPAPWEWDVKRLAASFVLACRDNGFRQADARDAALSCVRSYREHMAVLSEMRALEVWHQSIDIDELLPSIRDKQARKRLQTRLVNARKGSELEHEFLELVRVEGSALSIRDSLPLIFHARGREHQNVVELLHKGFLAYRESLPDSRRLLLDRFKPVDIAHKVVGVGSVGTACAVILLTASDKDHLFLQVKEARPSVLEAYAGKSLYPNHGQRVVLGCEVMQSASDLFLGWTEGVEGRHYYVRQLKDRKITMHVELMTAGFMLEYATLCGWTLARAHARSGEPAKISAYLGKSDRFDRAIADFSIAYADQCERDYQTLKKAVRAGKLEVAREG